ncbi:GntR family transcriptional regulator [Xylella taiwanensis]|uniref:HTH gntR-type domain-containing protein n=1 Tax=Xylella taiwanensis TaxID=1444770 RepID=Z9JIE6_9GAMM|nr:hypothetical protein AB672_08185 [Xylella taiwanensis]EWS77576.1 hypothetical protein AF72_09795 [Xylella taiwanensis]NBI36204.1 GntR family transcriptional regulator [Xylella taiwanensis]QKD98820.1 GntR family transcriptional regulator [Xylella taiwanensis]
MNELLLDSPASTPLYLQLVSKLSKGIRAGRWCAGEALPAERHLCQCLHISRVTLWPSCGVDDCWLSPFPPQNLFSHDASPVF